jgi:polygalacturonase
MASTEFAEVLRAPSRELREHVLEVVAAAAPSAPRPTAVGQGELGGRPVANAAWWGFDTADATRALQAAIDSPAQAVFVPNMGSPWYVRPIDLRSDLLLVLETGTQIVAKEGAFIDRGATLVSGENVKDVVIWGYGATLRMRKEDYSSWPYAESQWRHAVSFRSVANLGIYGLRVENAGGDGIYLGRTGDGNPYCENVVIRDVVLDNGNRQGLSIVSARRVLIERSTFSNTQGTLPQAGIDFEPNRPDERLEDIVVRDSLFLRNRGAGIQFFLWNMTQDSTPISVRIENSTFRGNVLDLFVARAGGTPTGRISVSDSQLGWRRLVRTPPGLEVTYE